MINWQSVIGNSFWIIGLALMLAGLSYYHWVARQLDLPFRQVMGKPRFQAIITGGLLLVGIGLAITAGDLLQAIPAVALILVCLFALFTLFRSGQVHRPGK